MVIKGIPAHNNAPAAAAKGGKKEGGLLGRLFGGSASASKEKDRVSAEKEKEKEAEKKKPKSKKLGYKKADTNAVALSLGTLKESTPPMTGEIVLCSGCKAALSALSVTTRKAGEEGARAWKCEFCGQANTIRVDDNEMPKADVLEYLLEPPAAKDAHKEDNELVVFCVDVSGSMCVTAEIPALQAEWAKLRGGPAQEGGGNSLNPEGADQYLPGQRRDAAYLSRLQCMKAALDMHLDRLHKQHPNKYVESRLLTRSGRPLHALTAPSAGVLC